MRRAGPAALLAVVWIGHVWAALRYPLGNDPAIFQFHAWGLTVGEVPWVDSYDVNTPGIVVLHWLWGALFGFGDPAFLVLALGTSTVCLGSAALWLRRRVPATAVLVGLAAGILAFTWITPWDRGQRELFQGALLLTALASGPRRPGVAGLFAGAAVTLKVALVPVVWLGWLAWLIRLGRTASRRSLIRSALASFAGFLVPLAAIATWLWTLDALHAFLEIQSTWLVLHDTLLVTPWTDALLEGTLPLFVLACGAASLAAGHWVLGVTHLSVAAIYFYQGHGWTYQLHIAIPLVAPTVGLLAARIPALAQWAALAACAVLAGSNAAYDHGAEGLERAERVDDHWVWSAHREVADFLQTNGPASDRVLTNNDEHQLLLMARRRAATPFLYGFFFSESHEQPALRQLAFARFAMTAARRPPWVVWNTRPYRPELDSLEANPALAGWIRASCREVHRVDPYIVFRCSRGIAP